MQNIASAQDLLTFAINSIGYDVDISEISLTDDLNLRIKIQGEHWDGFIDYRVARYVEKLQQDIFSLCNEFGDDHFSFRKNYNELKQYVIKVRVERGCTEIFIKIAKIFNNLISKIENNRQLAATCLLMLLSFGYISVKDYNEAITKRVEIEENEKTRREIVKVANDALELSRESQRATSYLFSQLGDDDRITIDNIIDDYDKKSALDRLNHDDKASSEKSVNIDDEYHILDYNFEKKRVTLKKGGIKFNALTKSLDDASLQELHDLTKEADLNDNIPRASLRITATICDGVIKDAYVVELGLRRSSSISVKAATEAKNEKKKQLEQCKLLEE